MPSDRSIATTVFNIPQLMFYKEKCTGWGQCVPVCGQGAILIRQTEDKHKAFTDRDLCTDCGTCVSLCPAEASMNHLKDIVETYGIQVQIGG